MTRSLCTLSSESHVNGSGIVAVIGELIADGAENDTWCFLFGGAHISRKSSVDLSCEMLPTFDAMVSCWNREHGRTRFGSTKIEEHQIL